MYAYIYANIYTYIFIHVYTGIYMYICVWIHWTEEKSKGGYNTALYKISKTGSILKDRI